MLRNFVKPHPEICVDGFEFEVEPGVSICRTMLDQGIAIEHACELSSACTTCHVYVRKELDSLEQADDLEDDYLDRAWGLDSDSRLSYQAIVAEQDWVVEIPKYTINMVSEVSH